MLDKVVQELEKAAKDSVIDKTAFEEDDRILVDKKAIHKVIETLKTNPNLDYNFLMDLTAVDYIGDEERFEVIYQMYSQKKNHRLRVKVRVNEDEELDSISDLYKIANAYEREVWDMYGVVFTNHPNLTRVLMYEEFEGHPLRKDYPLKGHQPRVELRFPIETTDDPPYNKNSHYRAKKRRMEE